MNIKLITVCLIVLIKSHLLLAHNPNQASIKLIIQDKGAFVDFTMSQFGIEQVLLKKNPNLDLKTISEIELKQLIINEVKEQIKINTNGKSLVLGTGVIKLGSHESNLKFLVNNLPINLKTIEVNAHCFQENENQVNFFTVWYKDNSTRAKLFRDNNYQSKFIIAQSGITVSDNVQTNYWSVSKILMIITITILCFLIIYFLIRKRKIIALKRI
tara:strand:- start:58632 stop:59273 length:642 start_codon:yes stop_codon:yes gene_type:complete